MLNVNSKGATKEAIKLCVFRSPPCFYCGDESKSFGQNIRSSEAADPLNFCGAFFKTGTFFNPGPKSCCLHWKEERRHNKRWESGTD